MGYKQPDQSGASPAQSNQKRQYKEFLYNASDVQVKPEFYLLVHNSIRC